MIRSSANRERCVAEQREREQHLRPRSRDRRPRRCCWASGKRSRASPAEAPAKQGRRTPRRRPSRAGAPRRNGMPARVARVALEWPEVRQQPVRGGDRLCPLQVRVGGHQDVVHAARLLQHGVLQRAHARVDRSRARITHRRVAVATWSFLLRPVCSLRRDLAGFLVQQPVDHRVHVLVGRIAALRPRQAVRRLRPAPARVRGSPQE
jgi:hypothetical protein